MESEWQEGDETKRRRGPGKGAVEETEANMIGTCGKNLLGDLMEMVVTDNKRYLATARKKVAGVQNVANTCWSCGVWF